MADGSRNSMVLKVVAAVAVLVAVGLGGWIAFDARHTDTGEIADALGVDPDAEADAEEAEPVDGPKDPSKILSKIEGCVVQEPMVDEGVGMNEHDVDGNLFANCEFEDGTIVTARVVGVDPATVTDEAAQPDESHGVIYGPNFYIAVTGYPEDFKPGGSVDMKAIAKAVGGEVVPVN